MTNGDHSAFATPQPNTEYTDADNHDGLSKREYFAAMAMQGLLQTVSGIHTAASLSVEAADALIKALNEES